MPRAAAAGPRCTLPPRTPEPWVRYRARRGATSRSGPSDSRPGSRSGGARPDVRGEPDRGGTCRWPHHAGHRGRLAPCTVRELLERIHPTPGSRRAHLVRMVLAFSRFAHFDQVIRCAATRPRSAGRLTERRPAQRDFVKVRGRLGVGTLPQRDKSTNSRKNGSIHELSPICHGRVAIFAAAIASTHRIQRFASDWLQENKMPPGPPGCCTSRLSSTPAAFSVLPGPPVNARTHS